MPRRYLLAGLLACAVCGRRMESAWTNGKPAYRCRHGRTSAMARDPARPKNTYIREDKLLPYLPALHLRVRRIFQSQNLGPAKLMCTHRLHRIAPFACRRQSRHTVVPSRLSNDEVGDARQCVMPASV